MQTVTITVNSINDNLGGGECREYSYDEDGSRNGTSVLDNDDDSLGGAPSENNTPLTAQLVSGPAYAASFTLNADGTLLATGAADGFAKVWDVVDRRLVHEIYIGEMQVQGAAFVDDHHLAITSEHGRMDVYTLDRDELVELVQASVTRGLTDAECARYNFGDGCPDLLAER